MSCNFVIFVTLGDCCHVPPKSAPMRHGVAVPTVSLGPKAKNLCAQWAALSGQLHIGDSHPVPHWC